MTTGSKSEMKKPLMGVRRKWDKLQPTLAGRTTFSSYSGKKVVFVSFVYSRWLCRRRKGRRDRKRGKDAVRGSQVRVPN